MKLAMYRTSQFFDAFEAMNQGGLYEIPLVVDDNITLDILRAKGHGMQLYVDIAIKSAKTAFKCTGEDLYHFVILGGDDDKIPMFELDSIGWYELTDGILHAINNQLLRIEKYSGEAYCGPNINGAGPKGDEVYQALYNIRKLINIGVEKYEDEMK